MNSVADQIIRSLQPKRVLDSGCLLVEAFQDRGVSVCGVESLTEPLDGTFDLAICLETLQHLSPEKARLAVQNISRVTDTVLFSSPPGEIPEYLALFSEFGFAPDLLFDAGFANPNAMLLRKQRQQLPPSTRLFFTQLSRLKRDSDQHALLLAQVRQGTAECLRLKQELRSMLESPGWRLISKYRQWLNKNIHSRPLIRGIYEPAARLLLRGTTTRQNQPVEPHTDISAGGITYEQWIEENEPTAEQLAYQRSSARSLGSRPLISIIVPVYRVSSAMLRDCLHSVVEQTYDSWELAIVDSCPENRENRAFLSELAAAEPRIKLLQLDTNKGISENSNAALKMATGEYVAFLDHDDTLAPFALYEVALRLTQQNDLDLIYSDHDHLDETGGVRSNPLFKPDWSPEIMLSANYITHLTIIRRSLVDDIGGFDARTDGAQDWDLFLKVVERTDRIAHIPKLLYHWRIHPSSSALNASAKPYAGGAQVMAIQGHLERNNWPAKVAIRDDGLLQLHFSQDRSRKISIIIPSKDHVDVLNLCLKSLRDLSAYHNYEILIVDNGSVKEETHAFYKHLTQSENVRILNYDQPFNFSKMNNFGARHASGELLLFLNNDVEIIDPQWLDELVGWAEMPSIGVVGARLLTQSGSIQHAGVIIGLQGFAGHPFAGLPQTSYGMYGSTGWYRNYLAVTGACMMLRREVFDALGGFDESFVSCGSDVEICLRVWRSGLRVVYNPFARLIHFEGETRRGEVPPQDYETSFTYYKEYLEKGDPFWNPNLSPWSPGIALRGKQEESPLDFAQKHRETTIDLGMIEDELVVARFDFSAAELRRSAEGGAALKGYHPIEKVIWFTPSFENPFYGGIHTILRFANWWSEHKGVRNHFAICDAVDHREMSNRIRAVYASCSDADVSIIAGGSEVTKLPKADACVATLWTTAYYALRYNQGARKFYFIQDDEAAFYRAGSTSALVEATYRFGFYGITNTVSLKEMYEQEFNQLAVHFTPQVDLTTFHPDGSERDRGKTLQLFCYARPQHPRNAFELLSAAMRKLKTRMGAGVRIVCAGAAWDPEDYHLYGVAENLGVLSYQDTAHLYRSCDVGAVLMLTRHPSYIPLELMASGCLVVTNTNRWTQWLLKDQETCLLSETSSTALAETLERSLRDHSLRKRIRDTALDTIRQRYGNWDDEIARIYEWMCEPR